MLTQQHVKNRWTSEQRSFLWQKQYDHYLTLKDKINGQCYGGVARMSSYIKSVREVDPEAMVLNAGDFYQGFT